MTIAVGFATVADSISKLSISGVTIKDIDQIPDTAQGLCPILFPDPSGFVTDVAVEFVSFGSQGAAKANLRYNLHYVYLDAEAGSGISSYDGYAGVIAKLVAISEAIIGNDAVTGAIDLSIHNIESIGVVRDASNNDYWGALLAFHVLEYVQ